MTALDISNRDGWKMKARVPYKTRSATVGIWELRGWLGASVMKLAIKLCVREK